LTAKVIGGALMAVPALKVHWTSVLAGATYDPKTILEAKVSQV
jgi:hypothetical protein